MARATERAIKRKPRAVVLLVTERSKVPQVPQQQGSHEFEWFEGDDSEAAMREFFDQNVAFHVEDVKEHNDMAYMAVEITDTKDMTLGRIDAQPADLVKVKKWAEAIEKDITKAFWQTQATTSKDESGETKKVRPRKKSTAAAAVKKDDDSDSKKADLKKRLDAKKDDQPADSGDKPPAKKAAAKKAAAKKETADA